MKKTIAILMILVLAGVGLFAANGTSAVSGSTNTATINLLVSIPKVALFGISEETLADTFFDSSASFLGDGGVVSNIDVPTQAMAGFKSAKNVGYLSGINNSGTAVTLGLSITAFTSDTLTAENPINLTVAPATATIPAATGAMGTLKNTSITVVETTAGSIDLAPAADDWKATITISVTSGA